MATFYHRTTQQAAWAILKNGFRDRRGKYMMDIEVEGVWLSDAPLDVNESARGDIVLAVSLDEREIACFEVVEEGKPYREWIVPAAWLNANSRPHVLSGKEEEDLARAFLAALDMEQTRSYLERGRQYESLSPGELRDRYVAAGEAFFGRDDQSRQREVHDCSAEYRLRKEDSPAYLLQDALDAASKRVNGFTDEDLARMKRFVEDMDKPKN